MIQTVTIQKWTDAGAQQIVQKDVLAIEEPLEIAVQIGREAAAPVSVTMRTPGQDAELAIGFLFTEGILKNAADLQHPAYQHTSENSICILLKEDANIDLQKLKRNFYTTSSCGVCGKHSIEAIYQVRQKPPKSPAFQLSVAQLHQLPEKLRTVQTTFDATGGIHASVLFDLEGNLLSFQEDVGRHNALDKLIGKAILEQTEAQQFSLHNRILLLSGRASFELIQKAAMAGIQLVCAIGAPSSLAVETANHFGITLVGFLKRNSLNVYSGAARIIA